MKDLNVARMINVVAAGSILLIGTGCGSTESRAAKKMCKAFKSCAGEDFEWDSMGDCIEYIEEYLSEYEDAYGEACGDAHTEFTLCGAEAYADSCDIYDSFSECPDEYEKFAEECEGSTD